MRITNKVVTEKYLGSINNIQVNLDKLGSQIYTGRKFMKASENTPAAVKAFQIRKDLSRVEGYNDSITHARGMLNNAESSISHLQDILKECREKIIYGINGTQSSEERAIVATEIRNLQQQVLQNLNSNTADVYYFGGNCVRQEPFSISADGKLQYRYKDGAEFKWIEVDKLSSDPNDPNYPLYEQLMNAGLFVDVGMGIRSDNAPIPPASAYPGNASTVTHMIDRNSVFTYTLPGIEITGVGTVTLPDGSVVSNNIYDLLGAIAANFDNDFTADTFSVDNLSAGDPPVAMNAAANFIRFDGGTLAQGSYALNFVTGAIPNSYDLTLTGPGGVTQTVTVMGDGSSGSVMAHFDKLGIEVLFDSKTATITGNGNVTFDLNVTQDVKSDYTYERGDLLLGLLYGWDAMTGSASLSGVHHDGLASKVQFAITEVGTKKLFLEFLTDRMSLRELDDQERQQDVEFEDPARTIIYYDSQRTAYQAALQMGTKVLPLSIFDFMR